MIILQCEDHCSNNPTADVSSVSLKWATLAPLFFHDKETDTDCAVGGVGLAGMSLCTSHLFLAPVFVYDTPLIYLYKI